MKSEQIKELMFKDFIKFLNSKGIDDMRFSMDTWMSKAWDYLYGEYSESKKKEQFEQNVVNVFSADELDKLAQRRKLTELKRQEMIDMRKKKEIEKAVEKKEDNVIQMPVKKDG